MLRNAMYDSRYETDEIYHYCENENILFSNSDFVVVFHEFLSSVAHVMSIVSKITTIIPSTTFDEMTIKKVVCNTTEYKRYPMVETVLKIRYSESGLVLLSSPDDMTYYLSKDSCLRNLFSRFQSNFQENRCSVLIQLIKKLHEYQTQTQGTLVYNRCEQQESSQKHIPEQKTTSLSQVLESSSHIIGNALEKQLFMDNSRSTINKIDLFSSDNKEVEIVNESDTDTSNDDNESLIDADPDAILEKIKELEDFENSLKEKLNEEKKRLDDEKDNLANFICKAKYEKSMENKKLEKIQEAINLFIYDKENIYPKIYDDFYVRHKFNGFSNLPPLFISKFLIFLFMEGRDHDGILVRQGLFGRPDEYEIYDLLRNALSDDDFELPDNEEYIIIIKDFLRQLPQINIVSSTEIMDMLNGLNSNPIFNEIECTNDDDNYNNSDNEDNSAQKESRSVFSL